MQNNHTFLRLQIFLLTRINPSEAVSIYFKKHSSAEIYLLFSWFFTPHSLIYCARQGKLRSLIQPFSHKKSRWIIKANELSFQTIITPFTISKRMSESQSRVLSASIGIFCLWLFSSSLNFLSVSVGAQKCHLSLRDFLCHRKTSDTYRERFRIQARLIIEMSSNLGRQQTTLSDVGRTHATIFERSMYATLSKYVYIWINIYIYTL